MLEKLVRIRMVRRPRADEGQILLFLNRRTLYGHRHTSFPTSYGTVVVLVTIEQLNMPIDTQDVIELVSRITCEDEIKVTVKQSLKAGFMAGGGAMIGGLLGGPVGVLIGGVAASCIAAVSLNGSFQPLHEVILQLPDRQKRDLVDAVRRIIENIDLYDITALTALVMGNTSLRMQIIKAVVAFAQNELRMEIAD